ncbi:M20 family metallopeptidase [Halocatena halophila]|uniref:M20 family metallopeptidase n=1 Tax=Halocatena halophila TaxID=2814576 RepID=UPI002ED5CB26
MAFDPLEFHTAAVKTPSHESVSEMRSLLVDSLDGLGFEPVVDARGNTIVTRRATADGPHLVLNTHLDTVSPPVAYERVGSTVYGRGACDAKGPLAALLGAFYGVSVERGRLTLAVTPDEETGSLGADALAFDADGYIVGEPTGLDVCTGARGRFEGTITINGTNAHAANPAAGTNAIVGVPPVLEALKTFDSEYGPGTHSTLGEPTLTPTVIEGGDAVNQLPAECTIAIDRRSVPPESAHEFERALNEHLQTTGVDASFALTDRESPFLEAFATAHDETLVETLQNAGAGEPRPFGAATEAAYFADEPTVVFGPGVLVDDEGPVAHADREYIERDTIVRATEILERAIGSFLG